MPAVFAPYSFVIALLVALLTWAAASDIRRLLIPNTVAIALAALYPAYVLAASGAGHSIDWIGGLAVGGGAFAVGVALFAARFLGGGDVKLIAATALWAGPAHVLEFLVITGLAGGVLALTMLGLRYAAHLLPLELVGIRMTTNTPARGMRVPYGVAVAGGGIFVAYRLAAG